MRLQIPLPDAYTLAPADELEQRIRTAKENRRAETNAARVRRWSIAKDDRIGPQDGGQEREDLH